MTDGFPTESNVSGVVEAPPKKSGMGRVVLIVLALIGLCSTCCCLSCGGFFWYSFSQLSTQVTTQYENDPVVVEHLGGISSCSFNFSASIEEDPNGAAFVFDVEGPEGSGQLIIISADNDIMNPDSVVLRKGGADYPLGDFVIDTDSLLE